MRRVVVTGIGLVTPLAVGTSNTWCKLINGHSGIRKIPESLFDPGDLSSQIAGIIPPIDEEHGFDPGAYIDGKDIKRMDRFIHLAIAAAREAVLDSGIDVSLTQKQKERAGVMVGSGIGGLIMIEQNALLLLEKGPRRISPFFIPSTLINLASGHISIEYGFLGPNHSVVTACASGAHAIGDAARIIMCDDADVMVCGGSEAAVCKLGVAGFASARALSTSYNDAPKKASRPWDKSRDGFVIGEGSGILVLEELEHAKKRGAKIYGEVIGYGLSGDGYHITAPEPNGDGAYRAMKMALKKAGISPSEVGYINAHGTSTPLGDIIEIKAMRRAFSEDINHIAISSTKSAIGHLLGAAGSVEAIFTLLAMKSGTLPPTLNLEEPDEGCDLNLVANTAQEKSVNFAMSNSFGFGGTNVSLIFKKFC